MPAGRNNHYRPGPINHPLTECDRRLHRRRWVKNLGVRDDPNDAGKHGLGYGKGLVCFSQRQQPGGVPLVLGRVLAVRINQDVDVGQLHRG